MESAATLRIGLMPYASAVCFHNGTANRQAQTQALRFGGKQGCIELVANRFRNSCAPIGNSQPNSVNSPILKIVFNIHSNHDPPAMQLSSHWCPPIGNRYYDFAIVRIAAHQGEFSIGRCRFFRGIDGVLYKVYNDLHQQRLVGMD